MSNPNNPVLISICEPLQPPDPDAGDFDFQYEANGLGHASFVANTSPSGGDDVRVTIDFTCAQSGNFTGGNTEGTPATLQFLYVESTNLGFRNNLGYILTRTGPTAVELADLSLSPESINWGIVTLFALLAAVTISLFVILRNRRTATTINT